MEPNLLERVMSRVTPVHAGEGRVVLMLFLKLFLLLFAYYLIKPVREVLILTEESAEVRSYVVALQAALLIFIIPAYTTALRHLFPHYYLVPWITTFLAANLMAFVVLGSLGYTVGVAFFIWLGIFSVLIVAQFWAFAADLFSIQSGERLFVLIALGGSLGAPLGSMASKTLFSIIGPYELMLLAVALLMMTVTLTTRAREAVPLPDRAPPKPPHPEELSGFWAGFRLVLGQRYLLLIAIFMILLNCVNSTGEYLLARLVRDYAAGLLASGAITDVGDWIGAFYGEFYFWVNILGLAIQLFLVARIFRHFGVGSSLLVLPAVAAVGYGLLTFIPVFAVLRAVKMLENGINYSLLNTARHALILPLDEETKYAGKTTLDTFFWRVGDLVQAGVVWVGASVLAATPGQFAAFNAAVCLLWLFIATRISKRYRVLSDANRQDAVATA